MSLRAAFGSLNKPRRLSRPPIPQAPSLRTRPVRHPFLFVLSLPAAAAYLLEVCLKSRHRHRLSSLVLLLGWGTIGHYLHAEVHGYAFPGPSS